MSADPGSDAGAPAGDAGPSGRVPGSPAVDVVVIGGGVAGLTAALECARAGLRVRLLEASGMLGGCVGRVAVAGAPVPLDSGAESFATRGGAVAAFLAELGLADEIADPNPAGSWLVADGGAAGLAAAPTPKTGVLGIPAHPLAADVRRVIGSTGALRAAVDRILPLGAAARRDPVMLGPLVRSRLGARVLDRLVTPISAGVYSADPEVLELESVAPGLVAAMREHGSLARGVEAQLAARSAARAGGAVRGLRGGLHRLVDALVDACRDAGVELVTEARVLALDPAAEGVVVRTPAGATRAAAAILAAPAAASLPLLGAFGGPLAVAAGEDWPTPASVELVTLVLDAPALDAQPRGTGLLVARGTPGVAAKALTHSSAKWPWLAGMLPPGRQVVRLSYGRAGEPNPLDGLRDDAVRELALADAARLLGVPLPGEALLGLARVRWSDALSHAASGQSGRVARLREAVAAHPGLAVTGAWVAGTGLASVVPHARAAALRVIRSRGIGTEPVDI